LAFEHCGKIRGSFAEERPGDCEFGVGLKFDLDEGAMVEVANAGGDIVRYEDLGHCILIIWYLLLGKFARGFAEEVDHDAALGKI
jgi:hypothetical protein